MDLLRTEYDIRHILAVSRKNLKEHALIRVVVSSLAKKEEVMNITKRDFRVVKRGDFEFCTVRLVGNKTRIMPIDDKTYSIISSICKYKRNREKVFEYTSKEMDEIVAKYSPPDNSYNVEKLRKGVFEILKDCMFFGSVDFDDLDVTVNFLHDFHPIYSGMWDLDDDEVLEDFIFNFLKVTGIRDVEKIANVINENVDRVNSILVSKV